MSDAPISRAMDDPWLGPFSGARSARRCSYEKTPMPNDFPGWYELQVGVKSRHGVMSESRLLCSRKHTLDDPYRQWGIWPPVLRAPPRLSTLNLGSASASIAAAVSATETAGKATSRRTEMSSTVFSLWTTVQARLHIGTRTPCCHRVAGGPCAPKQGLHRARNHSWSKSASTVDWRQSSPPT